MTDFEGKGVSEMDAPSGILTMTKKQAIEAYRCLVELWCHQHGFKATNIVIEPKEKDGGQIDQTA